eukprot:Awhi_evm2s1602
MKLTFYAIQSALALCVFCPDNSLAAPIVECRSISSQVTDRWCQQVACADVYKEFCQMGSDAIVEVSTMQHLDSPYHLGHLERPLEFMEHLDNPNPSGHSGKPMEPQTKPQSNTQHQAVEAMKHLDSPYPNGHSERPLEQGQHLDSPYPNGHSEKPLEQGQHLDSPYPN